MFTKKKSVQKRIPRQIHVDQGRTKFMYVNCQNVLCLACFLLNFSGICCVKRLDFMKDPIFLGVITFLSTYCSQRLQSHHLLSILIMFKHQLNQEQVCLLRIATRQQRVHSQEKSGRNHILFYLKTFNGLCLGLSSTFLNQSC